MSLKSRREFLSLVGSSAVAIPISSLLVGRSSFAQDMPQLDESDPQATALEYVHQSPNADETCSNCQLYQGEADAEWGGCTLFPGKAVAANGWCKSWVQKTG